MGSVMSRAAPTTPVVAVILLREPWSVQCMTSNPHAHTQALLEIRSFGECFPGGKIELGETPEAAARRELWEELRVRVVGPMRPVGPVKVHGAFSIRHFLVSEWESHPGCVPGRVVAREGQRVRWVPVTMLASRPLSPSARAILVDL